MSFFPFRGPPWAPKPRKTRSFLIAPRWNSGTAKGTKHRKTRCFWTPWAEYTVNYKGSGTGEVTPRWAPWGRRQGRQSTITFGYQPKASGKGTDRLGSGRRPDLRATAHAADPKDKTWWPEVVTCMTLSTPYYEKCMSPSRPYGKSKWHGVWKHTFQHSFAFSKPWGRPFAFILGTKVCIIQIYVHKG